MGDKDAELSLPLEAGAPDPVIRYADAVTELETILEQLEEAEIDVDTLSTKVERAAHLLRICRQRISKAEARVVNVLREIEEEASCQSGVSSGD